MGVRSVLAEWQNLAAGKIARIVEEANGTISLYLGGTDTSATEGKKLTGTQVRAVTAGATLTDADDGDILTNSTASNLTFVIPAGLQAGFSIGLMQNSTGTMTLDTSAITPLGGTYATTTAGDVLSAIQSATNVYTIKKA